jgi:hypothetical protein
MPDNNNKTTYELLVTISFLKADYYESDSDFLNHQFIAMVPPTLRIFARSLLEVLKKPPLILKD